MGIIETDQSVIMVSTGITFDRGLGHMFRNDVMWITSLTAWFGLSRLFGRLSLTRLFLIKISKISLRLICS